MRDFQIIEADTGLEGLIVRPLSAKRLPLTRPEEAGILDRNLFFGIEGRSRAKLLDLARHYGIKNPPAASAGCALTAPDFARKVRDIFEHSRDYQRWEFETLRMGRHFRVSPTARVIVARNESQNEYLTYLHPRGTALMTPENFQGPAALVAGEQTREIHEAAGRLILRYSHKPLPENPEMLIELEDRVETVCVKQPAGDVELEKVRIA